jgi:hypothetical protein
MECYGRKPAMYNAACFGIQAEIVMHMKRVTLTFDNGPTPGITEHVLDLLSARRIQTTFFIVVSLYSHSLRKSRSNARRRARKSGQNSKYRFQKSLPTTLRNDPSLRF